MFFWRHPNWLWYFCPVKVYLCFQSHNASSVLWIAYADAPCQGSVGLHTCKLQILCLSDFSTSTVLCWETWEMQAHSLDMCRVCGCPLGVQSQGPSVDPPTFFRPTHLLYQMRAIWKHMVITWCILDKSNAVWVKDAQWPFLWQSSVCGSLMYWWQKESSGFLSK